MSKIAPSPSADSPSSLAERFWRIARARAGTGVDGDSVDPVMVVRHVLSILDALDRGESAAPVSVRTVSFLKLLRQSETEGDLSYAAPEQIAGEILDERSLVFSVGVLLFERLTGRHPFGAEGNQVRRVARIRKGEFGSGVNYFPTVPQGLRTILMRAMGPFPEERWTNLRELREHLEQFVEQEDTALPALPGTTVTRSRKRRAPKSDRESTRVVDMGEHVRSELRRSSERHSRASQETSGLIEAKPVESVPPATPEAREPTVQATPAAQPITTIPAALLRESPSREAALLPDLPKADYEPRITASAPAGIKPWVYIGIGAALASLLFLLLSSGDDAVGTAATPSESASVAKTKTGPSAPAAATPTSHPPQSPSTTSPTTAPAPVATPASAAPAAAALAAPDPQDAGIRALTRGRSCLTNKQLRDGVQFGVGILLDGAGRVKKVYFAGQHSALPYKQRSCMRAAMIGAPVAGAVPAPKLTHYHARMRGEEIRVSFK